MPISWGDVDWYNLGRDAMARMTMQEQKECEECGGSGDCPWCDGTGTKGGKADDPCDDCAGTGECSVCHGSGEMPPREC